MQDWENGHLARSATGGTPVVPVFATGETPVVPEFATGGTPVVPVTFAYRGELI